MICVLNYLSSLAATTAAATGIQHIHYIANQVEWFYGEMFIGMTVLYGFIAAIFGYFIPRHNLRALHEKIDAANADLKKASEEVASTKRSIDQQEAAIAEVRQEFRRELEKLRREIKGVLHVARGLSLFTAGSFRAAHAPPKPDQNVENSTLLRSAIECLAACHQFYLAGDYSNFLEMMDGGITALRSSKASPSLA